MLFEVARLRDGYGLSPEGPPVSGARWNELRDSVLAGYWTVEVPDLPTLQQLVQSYVYLGDHCAFTIEFHRRDNWVTPVESGIVGRLIIVDSSPDELWMYIWE